MHSAIWPAHILNKKKQTRLLLRLLITNYITTERLFQLVSFIMSEPIVDGHSSRAINNIKGSGSALLSCSPNVGSGDHQTWKRMPRECGRPSLLTDTHYA
ncbi:hypothetical protein C7475_110172 [Chitinophaga sp. S165]|nr:hypothetical protein C7475_110172 [Chitinophaga sp. S165]